MKEQLTNEPRYILYDFGFMKKDGRRVNKLAFIFWWVRLFSVFIAGDSAQNFPLVSRHFNLGWILLVRQNQSCKHHFILLS